MSSAAAASRATVRPALDSVAILVLPFVKLMVQLLTAGRYGYFRDELYFMDCARHLDWGYADCAPLIAVWTRIGMALGPNLLWFRVPAVLAGVALLVLTAVITRELGGGKAAQRIAAAGMLLAPGVLGTDTLLTMNAFEPVFWMGAVWSILLVQRTGNSRYWLLFGVWLGMGLMNKHSTLFFGAALFVGLVVSPLRREFAKPWIWLGALVALAIFSPNLIWQAQHDFATLELLRRVQAIHKNVVLSPLDFFLQNVLAMNIPFILLWGAGVMWTLFDKRGVRFRWIGVTWVVLLVLYVATHAKNYYFFPIFGMVFAAGAAAWDVWHWGKWVRVAVLVLGALTGIVLAPLVVPVLPPDRLVAYMDTIHLRPPKTEVGHSGPLPQVFGDQFGWQQLVREVASDYEALPAADRAHTALFANNYGEAGAIDFYGLRYGLPHAISGHENYWFWGPQGQGAKGSNLIVLQDSPKSLARWCDGVQVLSEHSDPWGMAEENRPILYCRGLKASLADIWPMLKKWN